jgi:Holliday junction resolvase
MDKRKFNGKPRQTMKHKIEVTANRLRVGNPYAQFKAAQGELEAAIFFSRRGYYVYRNIAQAGPDLVVIKNDRCRVVEVKSHNKDRNHHDNLQAPRHLCDFVFYVRKEDYILVVVETNEKKIFPREVI